MSFETFAVVAYTYYPVVWRKVYDDALRASHLWQPEATGLDVLLMRGDRRCRKIRRLQWKQERHCPEEQLRSGDIATYIYMPSGSLENPTDGDENPFRFSNEYHDDETALVYL